MTYDTNYDVVVVGGGLAGLSAANRAAQQGLKVAVLERGQGAQYLCNSRYSGGVLHIACHNAQDKPEKLMEVIKDATSGKADPALSHALAHTAGRAIDWLRAEGAKYIRVGNIVWQQHVLAPPRPIVAGLDWKGRGPDVTLRQLVTNLEKRGGKLIQTPAASLMEREGRCVGVEAGDGASRQQITARAVVLADGGFQGNAAMVREHMGIDRGGPTASDGQCVQRRVIQWHVCATHSRTQRESHHAHAALQGTVLRGTAVCGGDIHLRRHLHRRRCAGDELTRRAHRGALRGGRHHRRP